MSLYRPRKPRASRPTFSLASSTWREDVWRTCVRLRSTLRASKGTRRPARSLPALFTRRALARIRPFLVVNTILLAAPQLSRPQSRSCNYQSSRWKTPSPRPPKAGAKAFNICASTTSVFQNVACYTWVGPGLNRTRHNSEQVLSVRPLTTRLLRFFWRTSCWLGRSFNRIRNDSPMAGGHVVVISLM